MKNRIPVAGQLTTILPLPELQGILLSTDKSTATATSRSLMLFKGCPVPVGATVLLQGTDSETLRTVKRIASYALYAAYWNRLEVASLTDQLLASTAAVGSFSRGGESLVAQLASVAAQSFAAVAMEAGGQGMLSPSPHISAFEESTCSKSGVETSGVSDAEDEPLVSSTLERYDSTDSEPWVVAAEASHATVTIVGATNVGPSAAGTLSDLQCDSSATLHAGAVSTVRPSPSQPDPATESAIEPSPWRQSALWLSISCKNPAKSTMCEPPHAHGMKFYQEAGGYDDRQVVTTLLPARNFNVPYMFADLPLAAFLAAAAPSSRKCPHPHCGEGAGLHLRCEGPCFVRT
jgi:hypothetical protein